MPSEAAKRRKDEKAAKRAAKGFGASGRGGKERGDASSQCACCASDDADPAGVPSHPPLSSEIEDAQLASTARAASAVTVAFPPSLTSRQRAVLHAIAEANGVVHRSDGEGASRAIALGSGPTRIEVPPGEGKGRGMAREGALEREDASGGGVFSDDDGPSPSSSAGGSVVCAGLDDDDLCRLLHAHLRISLESSRATFAAPPPSAASLGRDAAASASSAPAVTMANISLEPYVEKMRKLLELERLAEVEQSEGILRGMRPETAQKRGRALLGLRCADLRGGLLGKTIVTLEMAKRPTPDAPPLPPHKLSPHDVVAIRPSRGDPSGEPLCSGVVYRVRDSAVEVAVDDAPDALDGALRIERLANETSHQRLVQALERVGRAPSGAGGGPQGGGVAGARLVDVMFGRVPPRFGGGDKRAFRPVNKGLDASQRAAVEHALSAADVALIHGPPGTGKTTAVVEYIAQEVMRGARVLACTASNIAIDNLVERLVRVADTLPAGSGASAKIVRLGHPARLLPSVLDASLEAQVLRSDNSALARDCEKECRLLRQRLLKLGPKDRAERNEARRELRGLAKEEKSRQKKAIEEVIKGSNVVCCTLAGALSYSLRDESFDVVVIDEAAQALEAACWGALLKGRKAVLAGDHLQLPPTVLSDVAARDGLSETLFARVHAKWHKEGVAEMLTVQYRMNQDIMQWASEELYEGKLTAADVVARHTLGGIDGENGDGEHPVLMLVDTAGCDMEEHCEEEGDSKQNPGEAAAVIALVRRLVASGVSPEDIGVITPYSAQVGVLRDLRAKDESLAKLEISTVDGFQGREKEAIVVSAVRSNPRGDVGFLSDVRRMNVAITRARRHCCLVCDTETVGRKDAFLQRLVSHFEARGEYISAAELENVE